jgi:hypothetical protein
VIYVARFHYTKHEYEKVEKNPSKFSLGIDQRTAVLQDPSSIIDHVLNDLLSREDLLYLSSDATGEPRSGTERLFGVLLEIIFDWDNTLFEESFSFSLAVVLPELKKRSMAYDQTNRCFPKLTNRQRKDS